MGGYTFLGPRDRSRDWTTNNRLRGKEIFDGWVCLHPSIILMLEVKARERFSYQSTSILRTIEMMTRMLLLILPLTVESQDFKTFCAL